MTKLIYRLALGLLPMAGIAHADEAPLPTSSAATLTAPVSTSPTVQAIRAADRLDCGTVTGMDDWNGQDIHGNLSALGAEICHAIGIAILGSEDKVVVHAYPAEPEALAALKTGLLPVVIGISPSTTNAVQYGVGFGPPVFYDSQRIMVNKRSGVTSLAGVRDKLICALDSTLPETTLRDVMAAKGIPIAIQSHSEQGEMDAAIAVGQCLGTGMESRLVQSRANFHAFTPDFVMLPERLSLEPVVPAYRYGDPVFGLIVDYTVYALLEAEALGITKANVADAAKREDVRALQLLGGDFATAQSLGLAHDWAASVIAETGNYGEIFQETTGEPYHLDRGLNRLWSDGGMMPTRPVR